MGERWACQAPRRRRLYRTSILSWSTRHAALRTRTESSPATVPDTALPCALPVSDVPTRVTQQRRRACRSCSGPRVTPASHSPHDCRMADTCEQVALPGNTCWSRLRCRCCGCCAQVHGPGEHVHWVLHYTHPPLEYGVLTINRTIWMAQGDRSLRVCARQGREQTRTCHPCHRIHIFTDKNIRPISVANRSNPAYPSNGYRSRNLNVCRPSERLLTSASTSLAAYTPGVSFSMPAVWRAALPDPITATGFPQL